MSNTRKVALIVSVILGAIYLDLMSAAANGYGYMGYYGYHRGPSFWYRGGPTIYYERDLRSSSAGSSNVRGGGPSSGK